MGFVKGTLQILGTVCKPHLKFGGFPSQKPLKNQSKFKKSKNQYFSRTLNILKSIVYQQKVLKPNSLLKLNEKKRPHFFHRYIIQSLYRRTRDLHQIAANLIDSHHTTYSAAGENYGDLQQCTEGSRTSSSQRSRHDK